MIFSTTTENLTTKTRRTRRRARSKAMTLWLTATTAGSSSDRSTFLLLSASWVFPFLFFVSFVSSRWELRC